MQLGAAFTNKSTLFKRVSISSIQKISTYVNKTVFPTLGKYISIKPYRIHEKRTYNSSALYSIVILKKERTWRKIVITL